MKPVHLIYIIFAVFVFYPFEEVAAKRKKKQKDDRPQLSDTIFHNVVNFAPYYEKIVEEFHGDMYLKGKMNIIRQNHLIRVVPSLFKPEKNVKEYMAEAINEIHYTAPDIYDLKVKAINGTIPRYKGINNEVQNFFRVNIYSASLLTDKLYSPLAKDGRKYYRYYLDSLIVKEDYHQYLVQIVPKNKSSQLVSGYMLINEGIWTVQEMYMEGETDFTKFKLKLVMGDEGDEQFLPRRIDADIFFNFVGNKVEGDYSAYFDYDKVVLSEDGISAYRRKNKYDLTDYFSLTLDSTTSFSDSAYFAAMRPIPLDKEEEKIYVDYALRRDTTSRELKPKTQNQLFIGQLGDILFTNYTVNISDIATVKCSPLINPLLVSYSPSNGYSYRQEFKFNQRLKNNRLLRIVPKLGYNFTRKEFYWSVNNNFDYWPRKRASVNINFGNGNRIYGSNVLNEIKDMPDSLLNFDKLDLTYFKDLFFAANHEIEVANGFKVIVGLMAHKRTPIRKVKLVAEDPDDGMQDIIDDLPDKYISFAPRVRLELTPGLYYYKHGNRKINLYSKFPTFSVDWERGIKGVFGSNGKYEKIEVDMQHKVQLGLMRSLSYRIGAGTFTEQEQLYFLDFANFSRKNLPVGWNDDIGGVFQLLDRRWYNSSLRYARGHITYESPFLIWPHLMKYTSLIENERLYFSMLFVPHLTPYIEIGYGIGTHIFDLGVFVSNVNGKFKEFGCKFTFELFNK